MKINITQEKHDILNNLTTLNSKLSKVELEFKIDLSKLTTKIQQSIENISNDTFPMGNRLFYLFL